MGQEMSWMRASMAPFNLKDIAITMGQACDWSAMPCDMLASIFEHLDDYDVDRRRVGAVCKSWRYAASLMKRKVPLVKLPYVCDNCVPHNKVCDCPCSDVKKYSELRRTSYYFMKSPMSTRVSQRSNVWLIRAEETGGNKWLIHHPCTWKSYNYRVPLDESPPSSSSEYTFNLLKYKILDVAKLHTLHNVFEIENIPSALCSVITFSKVVLLPDLRKVFLLYERGTKLAMCSESAPWTSLNSRGHQFDDIIYHEGLLYAIDTTGRLVTIHPTTLDLKLIASRPKLECNARVIMHMVSSGDCLYLVYKASVTAEAWWPKNRTNIPAVWKMCKTLNEPANSKDVGVLVFNKQAQAWETVETLGDKVLFIANGVTFSVSAKELGWSEGSFIYFMCKDIDYGGGVDDDFGVYKLKDSISTKQEDLPAHMTLQFWPPPTWLCPESQLKSNMVILPAQVMKFIIHMSEGWLT